MTVLFGALTLGLILAFLSLGVFVSFRIFHFADLSADGTFPFGGAVAAAMITSQINPFVATLCAFIAGLAAGLVVGMLYTKWGIDKLLSGILVMTGLYSINLHIMGRSNIPLVGVTTVFNITRRVEDAARTVSVSQGRWGFYTSDLESFVFVCVLLCVISFLIYLFFRTDLGTAMRATGNNPQMITAQGGNTNVMIIMGLALSNGLIALSGALFAQYQGFADVQMGLGMLVIGIASVIIGESLVSRKTLGFLFVGVIMGSLLYRLLVALALRWGMNPNDLKIITAIFVFIALVIPHYAGKIRRRRTGAAHA